MWQPSKPLVYGVGTFFVSHYLAAGYGNPHAPDDLLQPPPLAAVVMNSTGTGSISTINFTLSVVDPITDDNRSVAPPAARQFITR
jgi:hypothetical protein